MDGSINPNRQSYGSILYVNVLYVLCVCVFVSVGENAKQAYAYLFALQSARVYEIQPGSFRFVDFDSVP